MSFWGTLGPLKLRSRVTHQNIEKILQGVESWWISSLKITQVSRSLKAAQKCNTLSPTQRVTIGGHKRWPPAWQWGTHSYVVLKRSLFFPGFSSPGELLWRTDPAAPSTRKSRVAPASWMGGHLTFLLVQNRPRCPRQHSSGEDANSRLVERPTSVWTYCRLFRHRKLERWRRRFAPTGRAWRIVYWQSRRIAP